MSLDNLIVISLEKVEPNKTMINRLLLAAKRNIKDSSVQEISSENRFDAAYKAIMQLANLSLQVNGFRTLTSKPGHHMTMIQSLTQTIYASKGTVIVLDALRKQRNIADYSGGFVPISAVEECISSAQSLFEDVELWLKKNKPEFID